MEEANALFVHSVNGFCGVVGNIVSLVLDVISGEQGFFTAIFLGFDPNIV